MATETANTTGPENHDNALINQDGVDRWAEVLMEGPNLQAAEMIKRKVGVEGLEINPGLDATKPLDPSFQNGGGEIHPDLPNELQVKYYITKNNEAAVQIKGDTSVVPWDKGLDNFMMQGNYSEVRTALKEKARMLQEKWAARKDKEQQHQDKAADVREELKNL